MGLQIPRLKRSNIFLRRIANPPERLAEDFIAKTLEHLVEDFIAKTLERLAEDFLIRTQTKA